MHAVCDVHNNSIYINHAQCDALRSATLIDECPKKQKTFCVRDLRSNFDSLLTVSLLYRAHCAEYALSRAAQWPQRSFVN